MVSKDYVNLCLSSTHPGADPDNKIRAKCHVVEKLPPVTTNRNLEVVKTLPFLQDKQPLADSDITNNVRIDVILSVTDCNRVYRGEHLVSLDRHMAVFKTIFGWMIQGGGNLPRHHALVLRVSDRPSADDMLERLWLREEPPKQDAVHLDTYQRLPNGRYSVTLPRKDPPVELGESRPLALKRYLANERSLHRNNKLQKPFEAALREYIELDHAELVPQQDLQLPPAKKITIYPHTA